MIRAPVDQGEVAQADPPARAGVKHGPQVHRGAPADPHSRRHSSHYRITDPTQPRTPSHDHILTVTTDNPIPLHANTTQFRTVSLSCDFVGAGKLGDLIEIRVHVTRRTRTMVFMSSQMMAGERVLMSAQGMWKIMP